MVSLADRGTLIRARRAGACAECGCDFAAGEQIYFSRESGSRHKRCVEPRRDDRPDQAAVNAAVADARRRAAGDVDRDDDWHRPCVAVAAGGAASPSTAPARDGAGDFGEGRPAAARGDAGGDDERRREVGEILQLVIDADAKLNEALQRIRRLLA